MPDDGTSKDWRWVERSLMLAAGAKEAKKTPLESLIYVPVVYDEQHKREIYRRRMKRLDPILGAAQSGKRFMLLVAELDYLEANARSWFLHAKQLPDFKFVMPETLFMQVKKLFGPLLNLWSYIPDAHMITIATFSVDLSGVPTIEALSLMLTTPEWIPIDNNYEGQLVKELVEKKRSFVKVLRYNLSSSTPIISALLTDVKPGPVAMFLSLGELVSKGPTDEAIKALVAESTLPSWLWDVQNGIEPPFPAKSDQSLSEASAWPGRIDDPAETVEHRADISQFQRQLHVEPRIAPDKPAAEPAKIAPNVHVMTPLRNP